MTHPNRYLLQGVECYEARYEALELETDRLRSKEETRDNSINEIKDKVDELQNLKNAFPTLNNQVDSNYINVIRTVT